MERLIVTIFVLQGGEYLFLILYNISGYSFQLLVSNTYNVTISFKMSLLNSENLSNQTNCLDSSKDITQNLNKPTSNGGICEASNFKSKYCNNFRCKKCKDIQQNSSKGVLHEKFSTV